MARSCGMNVIICIVVIQIVVMYYRIQKVPMASPKQGREYPKALIASLTISLSPIYTLIFSKILYRFERKGGLFMERSGDYCSTIVSFWVLSVVWLVLLFMCLFLMREYFIVVGSFLLLNSIVTAIIPISLYVQKDEYECFMDQIYHENLNVGQNLTNQQAHTIFQIRKHRQKIADLAIEKDRYFNRLDDGRVKALQADNYYRMQKWMIGIKDAADQGFDCPQIQNIFNEMFSHCGTLDLNPIERQNIHELAQMERAVVETNECFQQQHPKPNGLDTRIFRTYSHLDLRRQCDAPPSYRSCQPPLHGNGSNV